MVNGILATDLYSSLRTKTEYGERATKVFLKQREGNVSTFTVLGSEGCSVLIQALNQCFKGYSLN